jgi:hypothetical protein
MTPPTLATGITQGDLIVRHAILQAFKEFRANDWLLDYICAGIAQDTLTKDLYGQKEIALLKSWFKKTEIPVICYARLGDPEAPSVTINLVSSSEDKNTLADLHLSTQEDVPDGPWPDLTPVFTPLFNPTTGLVTLPTSLAVEIYPGMVIMDTQGQSHEILTVSTPRTFTIETGKAIDFSRATIRSGSPSTLQTLESATFNEQYLIGCHAAGEPQQLIFLHSIVVFALLWGREALLEARGFDNTHFSSSDFTKNQPFDVENVWSRYITLSGVVRNTWPKRRFQKITGVNTYVRPIGSKHLPSEAGATRDNNWIGDLDNISSLGDV